MLQFCNCVHMQVFLPLADVSSQPAEKLPPASPKVTNRADADLTITPGKQKVQAQSPKPLRSTHKEGHLAPVFFR